MTIGGQAAVLNIAHRGASGTFPENTLSAFRAAIEAGAEMCELDVQLTRDRKVVVIHDDTVERTTEGQGAVAMMTLEELQRLDAGAKFQAGKIRGEHIPTLDEVFDATRGRCGLNIELKDSGLEALVAEIMNARDAFEDSIVSCFKWDFLRNIQQINFKIRIGLLAEEKPIDLITEASAMRAYAINPRWDMVNTELCEAAHARGLKVFTWTVDSDARMRDLIACGVDGIMTNFPARLRQVLGG
jgi:glycerophosphoryl diester phosphodiesterase